MLLFRRPIPRVAAAALTLGACSDDAGSPDRDLGPELIDLSMGRDLGGTPSTFDYATAFCTFYEACEPAYFASYYADQDACVRALNTEIARARVTYGDACVDAILAYAECYFDVLARSENTCRVDEAALEEECLEAYYAYYAICDFEEG